MFSLNNKKALVTGASGGIGKEVAKSLVEAGASVILTGTREQALKEACESLGDSANYLVANLGDSDSLSGLFNKAEEMTGGIDILVCNAGITKDNLTIRMKDEEWEEVIRINLTATFKLNQEALKKMMKRRFGRIINITSVVGFTGNFGQANYCASKAGVVGMTKAIAIESATRGITVNCIAPGFIETPMTDVLKDEVKQQILQKVPMQRMGTPKEIANAVLFLASEEASYITGNTLHVNGGMYLA
ncbi:3-oxoacyl-(acyl-carrier-protein) reductase [endosymbiont of Acanthamoeba sp. UWC8]|uniref:3-oxoacyl-[acyl-carrier-protein] reductase n=1 Tax=endosymbiont of Acanthamoeba sp. UWC8 TaxID=86106 RepID=UPI0004D0B1E2|nr:3-oxoacyl-[acyl-carrier-protein] reductase [endosymbiont of Acanthamoeba sp. UWC8]AIF81244.1 3-oxoacyl-(acyl-carrier-protein) reductase [endosymbiont of Acanthamoeba sp. UWC8]